MIDLVRRFNRRFWFSCSKFLSKKGLIDTNLKFRSMTLPDFFIDQDTPDNMYKIANLDSRSIEEKVLDVLNSNIILQKQK